LFGVLTAKITSQNYSVQTDIDDTLFQVPTDYEEGEVRMEGSR